MLSIRNTEPLCFKYVFDLYQDLYGVALPRADAKTIADVKVFADKMGFFETDEPQAGDLIVMERHREIHFGMFVDDKHFTHSSYGKTKTASIESIKRKIMPFKIFAHERIREMARG